MTLGWTLIHFLWQGTALAAVLMLVLLVARTPRVRYAASCLLLAFMALAPVLTYALLSLSGTVRELGPLALPLGAGDALSRASAASEPTNWIALLPILWLVGVAILSARLVFAAWAVHRLTHSGSAPLLDAWPHLRQRLGITRAVTFLTSQRLPGPVQAGFLKPVILLPVSLLTQLPAAQLEAIIAHELAHIRRHDYLVNLFQSVVETLLFYHPAVWWVSRTIRAERELCCDELAAQATGNPRQYAEALLALEQVTAGSFTLVNAATGGDLRDRIARLLGHPHRPLKVRLSAVVVALLLAGAFLFPVFDPPAPRTSAVPAAPAETESLVRLVDRWHREAVRAVRRSFRKQSAAVPTALAAPQEPQPDTTALQQEVARLNREVDTLRSDTAARLQQQSGSGQLSPQASERLARTEAQQSLDRLSDAQTQFRQAADIYQPQHPVRLARLAQLRAAMQAVSQAERPSPYDRWLNEDVVYIITADELKRFRELKSDPEREKFIEQFWSRRDSNPATPENETKEEHYRRIAVANKKFLTAETLGWKTPRGRLYILKGPPDELETHPDREKWLYRSPREIFEFKP